LPPHSKNESVRPWGLLGGPVCVSLPNGSESIPAQCSESAALSPSQASPPPCSSPAKAATLIGPLWLFCSRLAASHPPLGRPPGRCPQSAGRGRSVIPTAHRCFIGKPRKPCCGHGMKVALVVLTGRHSQQQIACLLAVPIGKQAQMRNVVVCHLSVGTPISMLIQLCGLLRAKRVCTSDIWRSRRSSS
jgi:hypothetical protein